MAQQGLFSQIMLTEEWMQATVSPLYPQLWSMIRTPFDSLVSRRAADRAFRIMDEGETAQWLRPQIVDQARQVFHGNTDIKVEKRNQQFYLNYKDSLAITPKKLKPDRKGEGLTFSSYDTRQNMDYWTRREVSGVPMLPRLLVGYQFVEEMTDVNIFIAYPYGKKLSICSLIPDQTGEIIGLFQPTPDTTVTEDDKGYTLKPRKKNQDVREPS